MDTIKYCPLSQQSCLQAQCQWFLKSGECAVAVIAKNTANIARNTSTLSGIEQRINNLNRR